MWEGLTHCGSTHPLENSPELYKKPIEGKQVNEQQSFILSALFQPWAPALTSPDDCDCEV